MNIHRHLHIAVIATLSTLGFGVAVVSGQATEPSPAPAQQPAPSSHLLPGVPSQSVPGSGGASALPLPYGLNGSNPTGELAPAAAAKAGAQARLENLRDEVSDFVRIQRMVFDNSAAYVGALSAKDAAYGEFSAARKSVIDGLRVSADYGALVQLRDDTSRKIEIERERPKPSKEQLEALLAFRLSLGRKLADMETAALSQSTDLQDKRKSLMAAADKVDGIRREFELRMKTGSELALARRTVREAREMQVVTAAYYAQAVRTSDVLLNYAYYTQYLAYRRPLVVGSPILPYSYPVGGYGNGYGVTGGPGGVVAPGGVGGVGAGFGYVPYQ